MKRIDTRTANRRNTMLAVPILVATLAAAACLATAARAEGVDAAGAASPATLPIPEGDHAAAIERMFWDCDHAATTQSVGPVDAMNCSVVTELFKQMAFGGDFDALVAWWREHKPIEHAKRKLALAKRGAEPSRRDVDPANRDVDPGPLTRL